jgi:glycosyltransferase involved in cell wall biosynthesis
VSFVLSSPFADNDGYGSAGIGIMRGLVAAGADFAVQIQPGARSLLREQDVRTISQHSNVGGRKFGVPVTSPDRFGMCAIMPHVGVTMFETSRMPDKFAALLKRERGVMGLITPTKASANSIRAAECQLPIEIVPLGYDPADWYVDPNVPKFQQFTFLLAGQLSYRKGVDIAIAAFEQEFKPNEPVGMILKNTTPWGKDFTVTDNRIQVHAAEYTVEQLRTLYNQVHCYIGPSRGEGFGLVPLQALACGVPAILSRLKNGAAFFDEEFTGVRLVEPEDVENASEFWWHKQLHLGDCGFWYRPSVTGFRKAMREAYEKRDAVSAMPWLQEYTWARLGGRFLGAISSLAPVPV